MGPISEDNDSTIWVGSYGGGIFRIKPDSIINITSKEGLFSDYCYSLLADNKNIWVGHRGGLSKIRTTGFFVKPLSQYVGITNSCEFSKNAVFKDNENRILFGSDEGLWIYDPVQENQALSAPILNITSFKVNDDKIDLKNKLVLPPGRYKIKIDFLGINLKEPALVTYQYQLIGYDRLPEKTKTTSVTYPHLNDGKYTFFLWASSGDGVITKSPLTINIIIKTPVWKQWWFYILVFLLLGITVTIIIKRREYKYLREKGMLEKKVNERTLEITEKNTLLEEKQKKITEQNTELKKYRNYLEQLVDERTKELLKAKNKAEESDRLKTAFLRNISHEIRTPLNVVCGFSSLLANEKLSKEERSLFVKNINDSTDSLLYMIDEIMDISLLEANQVLFSDEKFNLDDLLNEIEDHYKLKNDKQIDIEYVNKAENGSMVELYYNKVRFHQVFTNLLNNALKFTNSGQIKFGYEVLEKSVRFFVSDTGIGIDKSEFDKIFDSFYKIENNQDVLYRGAGIGLTICKKIVDLMGGKIWVVSETGKGSTFYFSLPFEPVNKEATNIVESDEPDIILKKGLTILVAEDDEYSYLFIENIFKKIKVNLLRAINGKDAIRLMKENPTVSLILMDIKMPELNGYDSARQIRQFNKTVPIIAQTAYAMSGDKEKAIEAGCNDYITKPINRNKLIQLVQKYTQ